jgi:hypothetical protein
MKRLGMSIFPLRDSWNEFAGTPMEEPLDGSLTTVAQRGTSEANSYRAHVRECNSGMTFALMGPEIKSTPGNDPYCFRTYGQI